MYKRQISYYDYGRYGSTTTIELENLIKELEEAYHVFLTATGFGGISLALFSLCRPGDEILVSDNVYSPTKEIAEKLLKDLAVKDAYLLLIKTQMLSCLLAQILYRMIDLKSSRGHLLC